MMIYYKVTKLYENYNCEKETFANIQDAINFYDGIKDNGNYKKVELTIFQEIKILESDNSGIKLEDL